MESEDPMTHALRPRRPILSLLLASGILLLAAGCGGVGPTASALPPIATEGPHDDDLGDDETLLSPGADSDEPTTSQTDTSWGRIWDRLPSGFPLHPGAVPTDEIDFEEPVSGAFVVDGVEPVEVATWMQAQLETATYSTEALSGPFEDGSYVIDSVGEGDCRIETTIGPLGSMTAVTVRYGATCPNT